MNQNTCIYYFWVCSAFFYQQLYNKEKEKSTSWSCVANGLFGGEEKEEKIEEQKQQEIIVFVLKINLQ